MFFCCFFHLLFFVQRSLFYKNLMLVDKHDWKTLLFQPCIYNRHIPLEHWFYKIAPKLMVYILCVRSTFLLSSQFFLIVKFVKKYIISYKDEKYYSLVSSKPSGECTTKQNTIQQYYTVGVKSLSPAHCKVCFRQIHYLRSIFRSKTR